MGLVLFYHLTRSPLEAAMPMILTRALGAGWRVVVRGSDEQRLRRLDERLWLEPEDSFLPHGLSGGPHDELQPILLTCDASILPDGVSLMLIDGAPVAPDECAGRDRVWIFFDGNDEAAVAAGRTQWSALTGAGISAQYWSEDSGRWQLKVEKRATA